MKKSIFVWLILQLVVIKSSFSQISLVDIGFTFSAPLHLTHANDASDAIYVVERTGKVKKISGGTVSDFLDLSGVVYKIPGEMGLLGLAFHPDYKNNGYIYVNYNTKEDSLYTYISRFQAINGTVDKNTELKLLKITQPFENHKGGTLLFGNDGYLYIAMGDGGSGGDPKNNGQNRSVLLGKILRIDVNSGALYSIPSDNPYKGNTSKFKEEIFAYGLRNPWKMAVDKTTGEIWAADVGQGAEEEINIIENGKNYGWKIMEGKSCYSPSTGCNQTGLTLPVYSYTRAVTGTCSVTGGYVYRGGKYLDLEGLYIYGDYCSGQIWGLSLSPSVSNKLLSDTNYNISSFGEDEQGNIYVINITSGKVYRIEGSVISSVDDKKQNTLFLRPNPAKDILYITNASNNLLQYPEIHDMYGSLITPEISKSTTDFSINTSNMKAGMYTVTMETEKGVISEKFIIVK